MATANEKTKISENLRGAIQMRQATDEIISSNWIIMILIAILMQLIVIPISLFYLVDWSWETDPLGPGLMVAIGVILVINLVAFVLIALLLYKLMIRMNEHSRREMILRGAIIDQFKQVVSRDPDKAAILSSQIGTMERIHMESMSQESPKPAFLWVFLAILIPIIVLVPLYYLTKYDSDHDRRWHAFTQQVQYAGRDAGISIDLPQWGQVPERPFILYLLVYILFFPFIIYWIYVLIMDMNEHITAQWRFEDELLASI